MVYLPCLRLGSAFDPATWTAFAGLYMYAFVWTPRPTLISYPTSPRRCEDLQASESCHRPSLSCEPDKSSETKTRSSLSPCKTCLWHRMTLPHVPPFPMAGPLPMRTRVSARQSLAPPPPFTPTPSTWPLSKWRGDRLLDKHRSASAHAHTIRTISAAYRWIGERCAYRLRQLHDPLLTKFRWLIPAKRIRNLNGSKRAKHAKSKGQTTCGRFRHGQREAAEANAPNSPPKIRPADQERL